MITHTHTDRDGAWTHPAPAGFTWIDKEITVFQNYISLDLTDDQVTARAGLGHLVTALRRAWTWPERR